ncbi:hypothetical protein OU792_03160 [Algoriphagus sp. NF]|jgi:hypothetical protein|uniref:Uncharacterized protein n=1 Tax=Algoriphagus marincola TaxID=264027 RepID=A0ABS7N1D0_9BACT|nr:MULTISPECIES: hypothetical protein [Algoriphagus]MBY5949791.1 hypothetical protein [Algoriphagus marincola]MCR9083861.1 hypothetical protein [Cyclobacteriaceae bacterium]MDE0558967.1 hypothetical protein [Algoriphagus sp. NF]
MNQKAFEKIRKIAFDALEPVDRESLTESWEDAVVKESENQFFVTFKTFEDLIKGPLTVLIDKKTKEVLMIQPRG